MRDLSAAQLSLILSLVESEKYDLMGDIEAENIVDGQRVGLTPASIRILERRFWELAAIEELLLNNKTTATTGSNDLTC